MVRAANRAHLQAPPWALSYADLMSLLLVLFVYLSGTGRFPAGSAEDRGATREQVAFAEEHPGSPLRALDGTAEADDESAATGSPALASVYFERGSASLTDEARTRLEAAAPRLGRSPWPLVALGRVSPLLDPGEIQPQGDAHDLAFERAMRVAMFLESLPGPGREGWPELIPASAGRHAGAAGGLGADLHDARDRVDVYPIDSPSERRRLP